MMRKFIDIVLETALPPSLIDSHIQDAIDHADVYGNSGWSIEDFRINYLGLLSPEQIAYYDDFSSWVEVHDRNDLKDFRDGAFNVAKRTKFPPIIIITAPDPDGGCHTQVGDGRGRINWATAHDARLHVYHMTHRACDEVSYL